MDKDHTFSHFRTEFYQPRIFDRHNFDIWQSKGSPPVLETANQKYKEILAGYEAPELPANVDKALLKFIASMA